MSRELARNALKSLGFLAGSTACPAASISISRDALRRRRVTWRASAYLSGNDVDRGAPRDQFDRPATNPVAALVTNAIAVLSIFRRVQRGAISRNHPAGEHPVAAQGREAAMSLSQSPLRKRPIILGQPRLSLGSRLAVRDRGVRRLPEEVESMTSSCTHTPEVRPIQSCSSAPRHW